MKMTVFWNIADCSVDDWRFRGIYRLHHQDDSTTRYNLHSYCANGVRSGIPISAADSNITGSWDSLLVTRTGTYFWFQICTAERDFIGIRFKSNTLYIGLSSVRSKTINTSFSRLYPTQASTFRVLKLSILSWAIGYNTQYDSRDNTWY
jgi:hypothetical protein